MVKFSEMKYQRPDLDALKQEMGQLVEQLKAADSYQTAREVFLRKEELGRHIQTMSTLANIRPRRVLRRGSEVLECSRTGAGGVQPGMEFGHAQLSLPR